MEKMIVSTNVRYPKEIADAMKRLAEKHHRSINGEIIQALQEYIQRQEKGTNRRDENTQGV
jgi:predicted transcriptional regulator